MHKAGAYILLKGTALEPGEGGELDTGLRGGVVGIGVGGAKCVGDWRVRWLFCIHELVHRSL